MIIELCSTGSGRKVNYRQALKMTRGLPPTGAPASAVASELSHGSVIKDCSPDTDPSWPRIFMKNPCKFSVPWEKIYTIFSPILRKETAFILILDLHPDPVFERRAHTPSWATLPGHNPGICLVFGSPGMGLVNEL